MPGLLIAVAMACVNSRVSCGAITAAMARTPPLREMLRTTWHAMPALLLPVMILGGMRGGVFTPTEASVVAVFYALFVRQVRLPAR